jgi:hypothetical protein
MLKIDWFPFSNQITRVLVVEVYLTEVQTETINALSDSHPVTWLTKVVALLPSVADSLELYGLCDLALTSIRIGRLANG